MEISEEWIASLTRFETDLIKTYLDINDPKKSDAVPEIDEPVKIKECVHCKSHKIICYGHSKKGRQRYLCKDCCRTFTMVSKSFFKNTRISYDQWLKLMECEMIGSSLKETSYQTHLSVTSCFYLRHKLYKALEEAQAEKLKKDVQLDTTFLEISFKGMKNTPKPIKGSRKNPKSESFPHMKDPQVCISTAADEKGGILFLISGYGGESSAKYQLHIDRYDQRCRIISDGSSSIRKFCKDNHFRCIALTEGYHKTKDGKHISDVNSLHSDLKDLIRKKRNVSIRHLQGYLNWIVFKRRFILYLKRKLYDLKTYGYIRGKEKKLRNFDICKIPFPISLKEIYGQYHYGMFASPTQ
ncbi:MAG: IS1595 family transposase [Erysipelotrichaceae bacterium]|nr:IS1595 family transposase [Erysipelotrichaceae bacterium]